MAGRRYSIVLVEDNEGDTRLVDEMLVDTGLEHDLYWFKDAPSFERFFSEGGRADLVLIDLNVPGTSVHDLISTIKRRAGEVDAPIVAYTGSSSPEDMVRLREEGVERYLVKPMGLEEMEKTSAVLRELLLDEKVTADRS